APFAKKRITKESFEKARQITLPDSLYITMMLTFVNHPIDAHQRKATRIGASLQ
ncbi:MAG: hypothetical protein RI973_1323, partial [Bacteroidota bacterium]